MPTVVSEYTRNNIRRITYDDGTFEDNHNHPDVDRFINDLTVLQPLKLRPFNQEVEVDITYSGNFGTSGDPNIEYTIDDWTTTTQTHHASFTLTGITAGTYTLKVRDVDNPDRETIVEFEMPDRAGYGVRWRGEFREVVRSTTAWNIYQVDILELGYSGSISEICMGSTPVVLDWDSSDDDLFFPIRGSSAALTLMSESNLQFIDLATADDKQFMVKIYRGSDELKLVMWQGFVITDDYEEPYRAAPYEVQVLATDGIGLLKNELFESRTGEKFNRTAMDLREFMHYVIGRIGFHNEFLYEYLPLVPDGTQYTGSFDDAALASIHVNCEAFHDKDGEPWSIYDVVTAVLQPLGVRFFHGPSTDFWAIGSPLTRTAVYHIQYVRRFTGSVDVAMDNPQYTLPTVRLGFDFRETMTTPPGSLDGFHWVNSDQVLRIIPGAKRTGAILKPIVKDELHPTPAFNDGAFDATGDPISWEGSDLFVLEEGEYIDEDGVIQSSLRYTDFTSTPGSGDVYNQYIKHLPKPVTLNSADTYKVSIEMEVTITVDPADTPTEGNPESVSLYWVLVVGDQILKNDGSWETLNIDDNTGLDNQDFALLSADLSSFTAEQTALQQTHKFQIQSQALPVNDDMINKTANFRIQLHSTMEAEYLVKKLAVRLLPQGEAVLQSKEVVDVNTDFTKGDEVRELRVGQFNALENPADLILSTFTDSAGNTVLDWEIIGQTGTNELLDVFAQRIMDQHASNRKMITGSVKGPLKLQSQMTIDSVPYLTQSMRWDLKMGLSNAKFIEINTASGWPGGGVAPGG